MRETSIFWLRVATGLYAVGLLDAMLIGLRKHSRLFRPALAAFCVGVVLHFVSIVDLTRAYHQIPVSNFYESISLCAFLIALLFLFVYWRYQFTSLRVCIFPLVFLMTQVAAMEVPVATWSNTTLRDAWLWLHILLVLLGIAALMLTAIASVFYLVQERRLKAKKPGAFYRLPPLATLDNLITRSMGFGFAFLTLGVIAATTWAFIESGTRWIGDGKITFAFFTWALCLVMIFLRSTAGWRGRKAAVMALTVLGCSAVTWAAHVGLRPLLVR
ncbi:MAG TPA: cytochrome c biogenesis protein CcsA [Bryobacteraceae bacterium]|nr:cytochrome c biogenesis protein CcsA [Bryobacteraceae bacterium]